MKRLSSTVPLLLPLLLAACGTPERRSVPDPAAAIVAAPVEAPVEIPDFPGVVTSKVMKVVSTEFQGQLEKVYVMPRMRVKAGDMIAHLNTKELEDEVKNLKHQESSSGSQAAAYAAQAKAAAVQAKTEARLYNRGFQSRNATISAQARFAEARGQIGAAAEQAKSARARRESIEDQIKKADHPSPISGVVTVIKQKEGESLPKGTPIARVFDDSDLIIRFAVPKQYRHLVKVGGRVQLTTDTAQPIWATIMTVRDEEPPITFSVVEADIDDSKLRPDEIQVAKDGRVRLEPTTTAPAPAAVTASIPPIQPQPQPQPAQAGANR